MSHLKLAFVVIDLSTHHEKVGIASVALGAANALLLL